MKTISQLTTERHLLLNLATQFVIFGKTARSAPPKAYYEGLNRITKEAENAVMFCTGERDPRMPVPPRERAVVRTKQRSER